jgi:hypothetical protein
MSNFTPLYAYIIHVYVTTNYICLAFDTIRKVIYIFLDYSSALFYNIIYIKVYPSRTL